MPRFAVLRSKISWRVLVFMIIWPYLKYMFFTLFIPHLPKKPDNLYNNRLFDFGCWVYFPPICPRSRTLGRWKTGGTPLRGTPIKSLKPIKKNFKIFKIRPFQSYQNLVQFSRDFIRLKYPTKVNNSCHPYPAITKYNFRSKFNSNACCVMGGSLGLSPNFVW